MPSDEYINQIKNDINRWNQKAVELEIQKANAIEQRQIIDNNRVAQDIFRQQNQAPSNPNPADVQAIRDLINRTNDREANNLEQQRQANANAIEQRQLAEQQIQRQKLAESLERTRQAAQAAYDDYQRNLNSNRLNEAKVPDLINELDRAKANALQKQAELNAIQNGKTPPTGNTPAGGNGPGGGMKPNAPPSRPMGPTAPPKSSPAPAFPGGGAPPAGPGGSFAGNLAGGLAGGVLGNLGANLINNFFDNFNKSRGWIPNPQYDPNYQRSFPVNPADPRFYPWKPPPPPAYYKPPTAPIGDNPAAPLVPSLPQNGKTPGKAYELAFDQTIYIYNGGGTGPGGRAGLYLQQGPLRYSTYAIGPVSGPFEIVENGQKGGLIIDGNGRRFGASPLNQVYSPALFDLVFTNITITPLNGAPDVNAPPIMPAPNYSPGPPPAFAGSPTPTPSPAPGGNNPNPNNNPGPKPFTIPSFNPGGQAGGSPGGFDVPGANLNPGADPNPFPTPTPSPGTDPFLTPGTTDPAGSPGARPVRATPGGGLQNNPGTISGPGTRPTPEPTLGDKATEIPALTQPTQQQPNKSPQVEAGKIPQVFPPLIFNPENPTQPLPNNNPPKEPIQNPPDNGCCKPTLQKLEEIQKKQNDMGDVILNNGLDALIKADTTEILNRVGPQVPGGLSGFLGDKFTKLWKSAAIDRALALMNLAASLHNAAMLSRNLASTLGVVIENVLAIIGVKNPDEQVQGLQQLLGNSIEGLIKGIIGEQNYINLTTEWKKANIIYTAAVNTYQLINDSFYAIAEGMELIGKYNAKVGNALKKGGVVLENAYDWMSETFNFKSKKNTAIDKAIENLQLANEVASDLEEITSNFREVRENIDEIKEQKDNVDKDLADAEKARKDAEKASKDGSQSPEITIVDIIKTL